MNVKSLTAGLLLSGHIFAASLPDQSLIAVAQSNFADQSAFVTSGGADLTNTLTTGVSAYGDLTTGKAGASASAAGDEFQSIVWMADSLTFNTEGGAAADISFTLDFDGSLMSSSRFRNPYAQARVDIYNITGLDSWLETDNIAGVFDTLGAAENAGSVASIHIRADIGGIDTYTSVDGSARINNPLPRNGIAYDISTSLSTSLSINPADTYGILITMNTFGGDGSAADFLNTGTFSFTDLGGATYESDSGLFLSNVAPVPIPAAAWLFASALVGLVSVGRKRYAR